MTRVVLLVAPVHIVDHHQVKPAIIVIVKKPSAGAPFIGIADPGNFGDVNEFAVIVPEENRMRIAGHIEVRVAVVVIVADSGPHAVGRSRTAQAHPF